MPATIGQPAPAFDLKDQKGQMISNATLKGKKALVVFIPFPFTGVCEGELCQLRDELSVLRGKQTEVVVITCDTVPSNRAWAAQHGFEFSILSDYWPHGTVSQGFGCFNDKLGCAMRSTYVLDEAGVVRGVISSAALGEARSYDAYLDALAAL